MSDSTKNGQEQNASSGDGAFEEKGLSTGERTSRRLTWISIGFSLFAVGCVAFLSQELKSLKTFVGSETDKELADIGEMGLPDDTTKDAFIIASIVLLEQSAKKSEPFSAELAVALQAAEGHAELQALLDSLIPFADDGVLSRSDLIESWKAQYSSVYGFRDRIEDTIFEMFQIKSASRVETRTLKSVTEALEENDVFSAVAFIEGQNQGFQTPFSPWLTQAAHRIEVDAKIQEIRNLIFLSVLPDAS